VIASLEGVIEAVGPDYAIVRVGGFGLQVFVPAISLAALGGPGARVRLHTHLYFREDVVALYGFSADSDLRLFRLLMDVSGVGPRTALKMLSVLPADELASAIVREDVRALTRIPGVGKKTAARLSLELKGALQKGWSVAPGTPAAAANGDAVDALTALGYTVAEARDALAAVKDAAKLPIEEQVARALQSMGRR
jgi:Holliday junction DNA helicase RuvA